MVEDGVHTSASSEKNAAGGGIAWAGSLVGVNNPKNLGFRYSTPSKRYRLAAADPDGDGDGSGGRELPSNLQIQFRSRSGEDLAATLDVPVPAARSKINSPAAGCSERTTCWRQRRVCPSESRSLTMS